MCYMGADIIRFSNRLPVISELERFGFRSVDGIYTYSEELSAGKYRADIVILDMGRVSISVTDLSNNTECDAIQHPTATNMITKECRDLLERISSECFRQVFFNDQTLEIIDHVWKKYHNFPVFLWERFPNNAVFRHGPKGKWYSVIMTVKPEKLGLEGDEPLEVIDLKETEENLSLLIDNKNYFPGYHMNKGTWYTIVLDGTVPSSEIFVRIDRSFELTRR